MITCGRCGARLKEKVNVDMSLFFFFFFYIAVATERLKRSA